MTAAGEDEQPIQVTPTEPCGTGLLILGSSSIDHARLLEEQLAQASPDLLRELLGTFINTLLSAAADAVCGAE